MMKFSNAERRSIATDDERMAFVLTVFGVLVEEAVTEDTCLSCGVKMHHKEDHPGFCVFDVFALCPTCFMRVSKTVVEDIGGEVYRVGSMTHGPVN